MISVAEAKKIIGENTKQLDAVIINITDAVGFVLAEDIYAAIDMPPFNQAAMDGYAFHYDTWLSIKSLPLQGILPAGISSDVFSSQQHAVRIFTGAFVPDEYDTVVMQEKVLVENNHLVIQDEKLHRGLNVRLQGTDIKKDELALEKGSVMTPASIGFLVGIGVDKVTVYKKPNIAIIVTGNELQTIGKPIQKGQIYESNSHAILAILKQKNLEDKAKVFQAIDDINILSNVISKAIEFADIIVMTGGVSVGDFDFVPEALKNNNVIPVFHKVKQKPGKPFYFGKKEHKLIFGLPGNPAAVLTCFYEYVLTAIGNLYGQNFDLNKLICPIDCEIKKPIGLTHFLKAYYNGATVTSLQAQESYRLSSFAKANCILKIDEDVDHVIASSNVEIHLLPS